ncbi:MAG TPA: RES family NAD+ phosphorylase [Candidatus Angelobacter sp.]|nr:RES family NAD+ phosphorylase [Candidatus Angelobacter sp.]
MMLLWRISNHSSLNGRGGLIADGRWHFQGTPVVYLAENPAGALLEVLVHLELDITGLPAGYKLLKIEATAAVLRENLNEAEFPSRWRENRRVTAELGTNWLKRGGAALLRVPSAIVPETFNFVLNPLHPDAAKLKILWHRNYPWDSRLLRRF